MIKKKKKKWNRLWKKVQNMKVKDILRLKKLNNQSRDKKIVQKIEIKLKEK